MKPSLFQNCVRLNPNNFPEPVVLADSIRSLISKRIEFLMGFLSGGQLQRDSDKVF